MQRRGKYSFKAILLFAEAYMGIVRGKASVLFVSFKKMAPRLGTVGNETVFAAPDAITGDLTEIKTAINRAGRFAFFNSNCFDQALAAKRMLRRRNIPATIYFGVRKNEHNKLLAHAWVRAYGEIICGQKGMEKFTVVGIFGS